MALEEEERSLYGDQNKRGGKSERHILSFHARTKKEREGERKMLVNN
jgi:hypothetical protein